MNILLLYSLVKKKFLFLCRKFRQAGFFSSPERGEKRKEKQSKHRTLCNAALQKTVSFSTAATIPVLDPYVNRFFGKHRCACPALSVRSRRFLAKVCKISLQPVYFCGFLTFFERSPIVCCGVL